MLDCQGVLDHLFEYLDKEIDVNNITEIKAHLELCRDCFGRVEFERVLRVEIQKKTHHLCPNEVKNRIRKLIENF